MPEDTIPEKLIKLRYTHNLERKDLSKLTGIHIDTIMQWEVHNIMPFPKNLIKVCELFNIEPGYFHDYYNIFYKDYPSMIRKWMNKNKLTYDKASEFIGLSHSGLGRVLSSKVKLSYDLYLRLKELHII